MSDDPGMSTIFRPSNEAADEAEQRRALRRHRMRATSLLLVAAVAFLTCSLVPEPGFWVLLARAGAEAAMVGGLADWFAVTALFRHPLGLPIPHTALLPKNQARAARNVGRFFDTHFLEPAQLAARIRALGPSRFVAGWLARPANARLLAGEATRLLAALLRHDPPPRALARGRRWLRGQAAELGSDTAIAGGVADLVKAGMRAGVLDEVLGLVARTVEANRDTAAALVSDRSRWWIAASVDREVAQLVVSGVLSVLDDLRRTDSDLRRGFERAFEEMVDELAAKGALTRAVADARRHMIRSGAFDEALAALTEEVRIRTAARLAEDPDALAGPLAELIRGFAARALDDPETRAALDARIAGLAGQVIGEARPAIAAYVADVIAGWEPEELNARFEAEIGPDLQYIRINGAVLGALIGGLLYAFDALAG
jgi:uncharacterized membrane-anchored protein YjiN (DUF445 family)